MEEDKPNYKITDFRDCWAKFMELRNSMEDEMSELIGYYETNVLKEKVKTTKSKKKKRVSKRAVRNSLTPVKEEDEHDNGTRTSCLRTSKRIEAKKASEKINIQMKQTLNEKLRNTEPSTKKTKLFDPNQLSCSKWSTNTPDDSAALKKEECSEPKEPLPSCFVVLDRIPEPGSIEGTLENPSVSSSTVNPVISDTFNTLPIITVSQHNDNTLPAPQLKFDRPSRTRTRNKKYTSDLYISNFDPKNNSEANTTAVNKLDTSNNIDKGKKRKSDENIISPKNVKSCEGESNERVISPPEEETPEQSMPRTRTKEINHNQREGGQTPGKTIAGKVTAEIKQEKENIIENSLKRMKLDRGFKICPLQSSRNFLSPSATSNSVVTPLKVESAFKKLEASSSKAVVDSASKLLEREVLAQEKRNKLIKAKTEEVKRKREDKKKRVLESKQAAEHAKHLKLAQLQKAKEEKELALAESKRLKEHQILLKKQQTDAMMKEAEERRLKEEEAKKARLLKQEEEKRKLAEQRSEMAENAKKLLEMRLAQEELDKEAKLLKAEKKAQAKQQAEEEKRKQAEQRLETSESTKKLLQMRLAQDKARPKEDEKKAQAEQESAVAVSCESTSSSNSNGNVPKPLKNENDYGLSDDSGDSTDDERRPKKLVPKWATKQCRAKVAVYQIHVKSDMVSKFFSSNKGPIRLTNMECHRPRASSAEWNTPSKNF